MARGRPCSRWSAFLSQYRPSGPFRPDASQEIRGRSGDSSSRRGCIRGCGRCIVGSQVDRSLGRTAQGAGRSLRSVSAYRLDAASHTWNINLPAHCSSTPKSWQVKPAALLETRNPTFGCSLRSGTGLAQGRDGHMRPAQPIEVEKHGLAVLQLQKVRRSLHRFQPEGR